MITLATLLLVIGFLIPLIISPGPGNILLAGMGSRYGVRGSLPFWFGFELGDIALCLIYGFGLGQIIYNYPMFGQILKWIGFVYLIYLAIMFIVSANKAAKGTNDGLSRLGIREGFLSVMLNPKIHTMILAMFSQFLDPAYVIIQVFQLTLVFVAISVFCHWIWLSAGAVLLSRFQSQTAIRLQGWGFGLCIVIVAVFSLML